MIRDVEAVRVTGSWLRSVAVARRRSPLSGSTYAGRWLDAGVSRVLYLGRPRDSIVTEMYRHLVDPVEGMTADLVGPRLLFETLVNIHQVADLRHPNALAALGLTLSDLHSEVDDYQACQSAGSRLLSAGYRGVLVQSATDLGEVLAIFLDTFTQDDTVGVPSLIERWSSGLPSDPRPRAREIARHPSVARLREDLLGSVDWGELKPPARSEAPAYQARALCASTAPEAFFPEKGGSTRDAKAICARCEVKVDCLSYAIGTDAKFGVWGGMTMSERDELSGPLRALIDETVDREI